MIASISGIDWATISGVAVAVVIVAGAVISGLAWANRHLARPLRGVTGSPASPGVEAVPSMLERVAEIKTAVDEIAGIKVAVDENTRLTVETHDAVTELTKDHRALEARVAVTETKLAEVGGKIDGHLAGHPKQ